MASSEEEMTEWVDTLCRVCEFTSADDDDDDGECCYSTILIVTKYHIKSSMDFVIIFTNTV